MVRLMPRQHEKLRNRMQRDWFLTLVVSFALLLAVAQVWIQRAFDPPIVVSRLLGAVNIAALLGWILLLLRLRQPSTDMKYRWASRNMDRAMRKTNGRSR